MERTAAARTRDAPRRRAAVTMEQIEAFLRSLERRGRAAGTIQAYRRSLTRFYQALPPDKRVGRDTLSRWRDDLLAQGYTARTVNAALSAANSLLDFLGQRECQLVRRLAVADQAQPELDRREYLRLLSAARTQGNERAYLLVKVFAVTGVPVHGLPELTVEAVRANALAPEPGGPRRPIPATLRAAAPHPRHPAGGAAGVHPAAGAPRRAGVRDPTRAAPVPDGGDRRHPEPGRGRPGGPGEVQPPVSAEAVPDHPGGDRGGCPPAGGADPRPAAGGRAAPGGLGGPGPAVARAILKGVQTQERSCKMK